MAFSSTYVQNTFGEIGQKVGNYVNMFPTDLDGELFCYFALDLFLEGNNKLCNLGTLEFNDTPENPLLGAINSLLFSIYDGQGLDVADPDFKKKLTVPTVLSLCIGSHIWEHSGKTVFKIDREFAKHFTDTEKLRLYPFDLKHLPTNSMYVDVSETGFNNSGAAPLEGILVNVVTTADSTLQIILNYCFRDSLGQDCLTMIPTRIVIRQNECTYENGNVYYEFEKLFKNGKIKLRSDDTGKHVDYSSIDSAMMLVLNLLCYISCKKPDIVESNYTQKQKSRAERMKKPFDGVTEYQVGYRYGRALSLYSDKVKNEYDEHHSGSSHNSPRPHLVKAHWHGYWFGKGKTEFEYVWVAPYFKGYGEVDVVIHNCVEFSSTKYSKGEELLYYLLDRQDIHFEKQKYIPETGKYYDCSAFINGKEVFIEYDGKQHFKPVKNWNFERTVASDTEKNQYCKDHNIPLVRIRYDQNIIMDGIIKDIVSDSDKYLNRLNTFMTDEEYYSIRQIK